LKNQVLDEEVRGEIDSEKSRTILAQLPVPDARNSPILTPPSVEQTSAGVGAGESNVAAPVEHPTLRDGSALVGCFIWRHHLFLLPVIPLLLSRISSKAERAIDLDPCIVQVGRMHTGMKVKRPVDGEDQRRVGSVVPEYVRKQLRVEGANGRRIIFCHASEIFLKVKHAMSFHGNEGGAAEGEPKQQKAALEEK
jgi:hypothetical protein